jgi:hypothetical protein
VGRGNGSGDEWSDDLDEEFPRAPVADGEADVVCPYCGESVSIALDAGGGSHQEYVEDCEVCCRPWQVHVHYDEEGNAEVRLDAAQ